MNNQFYKPSILRIHATKKADKTVLKDVFFTAPYKIMNPFYRNDDFMTIMCMSSATGIMDGDLQEYEFTLDEGAKFEFISQSYEKIHRMLSGKASRTTKIDIKKNACFYYNPLPTQPFKDSAFESVVHVQLEDSSSSFIMKEIITGGRVSRGECFDYTFYHNLVEVCMGDTIIYRDNTRFNPSIMDLHSLGMHEGYTHMGTLLLFHVNKTSAWCKEVQTYLDSLPSIEGGVTRINPTSYAIRVLGYQGEKLEQVLNKIMVL